MADLPRFIDKMAEADDALLADYREDIVVVLLGPADEPYRKLRIDAQATLAEEGYRALVMETYPDGPKGELVGDKWARMLRTETPTHYFIVAPKDLHVRGQHVEFGYLMREHGTEQLLKRVRFFLEDGIDTAKALAAYEAEIIGLVGVDYYKDGAQLARRMARRIDNIVYGAYG